MIVWAIWQIHLFIQLYLLANFNNYSFVTAQNQPKFVYLKSVRINEDFKIGNLIKNVQQDLIEIEKNFNSQISSTFNNFELIELPSNSFNDYFNINSHLLIDSLTGEIRLLKAIDLENFCDLNLCSHENISTLIESADNEIIDSDALIGNSADINCKIVVRLKADKIDSTENIYTEYYQFDLFVNDVNEYAPQFDFTILDSFNALTNGKTITLNISEEISNMKLHLGNVAYDYDCTDRKNLKYNLTIISATRGKFKKNNIDLLEYLKPKVHLIIDTDLLLLFINESIDREILSEFEMSLEVSDNFRGLNKKASSLKIIVNVVDINDNRPVFENTFLNLRIKENVNTSTKLTEIKAVDLDSNENGLVRYELLENRDESDIDFSSGEDLHTKIFYLDEKSGALYLRKMLDYENEYERYFQLVIKASDSCADLNSRKSSLLLVNVFVEDFNDNSPVFAVKWLLRDEMMLDLKKFYEIDSNNLPVLTENSEIIYLNSNIGNYTKIAEIKIQDIDDKLNGYIKNVTFSVKLVKGVDGSYGELSSDFYLEKFQKLDDYENRKRSIKSEVYYYLRVNSTARFDEAWAFDWHYELVLRAFDSANEFPRSAARKISIKFLKERDESMHHDKYSAIINIHENNINPIMIIDLESYFSDFIALANRNHHSKRIKHRTELIEDVVKSNCRDLNLATDFYFDSLKLILNKSLDYELCKEINLRVKVQTSSVLNDMVLILSLKVEDLNDNRPKFDRKKYHFDIYDNATHPYQIAIVNAYDYDEDTKIEYFIDFSFLKKSQEEIDFINEYFKVDRYSGQLMQRKAFNLSSIEDLSTRVRYFFFISNVISFQIKAVEVHDWISGIDQHNYDLCLVQIRVIQVINSFSQYVHLNYELTNLNSNNSIRIFDIELSNDSQHFLVLVNHDLLDPLLMKHGYHFLAKLNVIISDISKQFTSFNFKFNYVISNQRLYEHEYQKSSHDLKSLFTLVKNDRLKEVLNLNLFNGNLKLKPFTTYPDFDIHSKIYLLLFDVNVNENSKRFNMKRIGFRIILFSNQTFNSTFINELAKLDDKSLLNYLKNEDEEELMASVKVKKRLSKINKAILSLLQIISTIPYSLFLLFSFFILIFILFALFVVVKVKLKHIKNNCLNRMNKKSYPMQLSHNSKSPSSSRLGRQDTNYSNDYKCANELLDSPILVRKKPQFFDDFDQNIDIGTPKTLSEAHCEDFETAPLHLADSTETFKKKKKITFVANV